VVKGVEKEEVMAAATAAAAMAAAAAAAVLGSTASTCADLGRTHYHDRGH